jgi:hypothetical protein
MADQLIDGRQTMTPKKLHCPRLKIQTLELEMLSWGKELSTCFFARPVRHRARRTATVARRARAVAAWSRFGRILFGGFGIFARRLLAVALGIPSAARKRNGGRRYLAAHPARLAALRAIVLGRRRKTAQAFFAGVAGRASVFV